jgi:hypothetical protein
MTTYQVFVSTTPGLEAYLEHEMRSILGATHSITRVVGGVELGFIDMHRIHQLLWCSSIAERIKLRIGSPFNCPTFDVLEQRLTQLHYYRTLIRNAHGSDRACPTVQHRLCWSMRRNSEYRLIPVKDRSCITLVRSRRGTAAGGGGGGGGLAH